MRAMVFLVVVGLLVGVMTTAVPAAETANPFFWTGVHWQQVTEDGKAGYIFGMGNLADYEITAAGTRNPPCISRAFVDELKSRTVLQIVQEVDAFFKENPGKLNTPVIEVVLERCTKICSPAALKGGTKK